MNYENVLSTDKETIYWTFIKFPDDLTYEYNVSSDWSGPSIQEIFMDILQKAFVWVYFSVIFLSWRACLPDRLLLLMHKKVLDGIRVVEVKMAFV